MSHQSRETDERHARDDARMTDEVEILMALIKARYGDRLTPEQVDGVRLGVQGVVEAVTALRAVRLANADEPHPPFSPVRTGE
jgi:hypothetical protein